MKISGITSPGSAPLTRQRASVSGRTRPRLCRTAQLPPAISPSLPCGTLPKRALSELFPGLFPKKPKKNQKKSLNPLQNRKSVVHLHSQSSTVVVQLVRIPACHAGGRGFESRPYRKISKRMIAKPCKFTFTRLFLYSQPNNTISDMPDMPHLPFSAVAFSVAIS